MKEIYILLTDTGTVLTRCISLFTRKKYNHSSLCMDEQFVNVYSFGRKDVENPFDGGFVKEDLSQAFFLNAQCQVYRMSVTEEQYLLIKQMMATFELDKEKYRYNFLGLITLALRQNWERENAFFCSQFLAHVLEECELAAFEKPCCRVTPFDLIQSVQAELIYQGLLFGYLNNHLLYTNQTIRI